MAVGCAIGMLLAGIRARSAAPQDQSKPERAAGRNAQTRSESAAGNAAFAANCAGCHGLDGQGSDKAPGIAGSARVQSLSEAQLSGIISNGIPGTGMPPFQSLGQEKIRAIVSYVRGLRSKNDTRSIPGDTARGKEIFFGKGGCSSCHSIFGAGGFLGPDLSAYGSATSAQAILDAILSTDRAVPAGYRLAIITIGDGSRVEGVIRNEDNFSLQMQTKDGSFHFFQKSNLKNVERPAQSLMPTDYRGRLTSAEMNDLVKYLIDGAPQKPRRVPQDDDDDEADFK